MTESFLQSILPSIEHFHSLAYWLAFLAAFAETALIVGLLVPGSTLLLLLGALAGMGTIEFAGVYWFAVAGAILGDNLNYALGRRYGQAWLQRGVWFLKPEHFAQAHDFFARHGSRSVFLGRFVPSIKEIVPFVAGSAGMPKGQFLFWNLLGSLGWGLEWVGAGYLFGQSLAVAQAWISRIGLFFLALLLLWLLFLYIKHLLLKQGPQIWQLLQSLFLSLQQALARNPYVEQFVSRHPRGIEWLRKRLDRRAFTGLPLTLLALSLLYVAFLFGGIVEDFLTSDPIVAVDQAVAQLMARYRPAEIIPAFLWITALGVGKVAGGVILLALASAWLYRGRWAMLSLAVSTGGTILFTFLGKLAFHRPRPAEAVLLENSYSFPSGHASIAVGFYGFLGYLWIRSATGIRPGINRSLVTLIVILAIGLSRIVLGVHYLSDVWAGYLVGAGWLVIGITISEWATSRGWIDWHEKLPARNRYLLTGIGALALAWYGYQTLHWHPQINPPSPDIEVSLRGSVAERLQDEGATHTETLLGAPSQPVSLAFLARNFDELEQQLMQAGWKPSDPPGLASLMRLVRSGMDYETAPLAPVFWKERIEDRSYEHVVPKEGGKRVVDALRLWKTPWRIGERRVFVGVARMHVGMKWYLLHRIDPDTDAAAEFVVNSLKSTPADTSVCQTQLVPAEIGEYLLGMQYFSSGKLWILDLQGQMPPAACQNEPKGKP